MTLSLENPADRLGDRQFEAVARLVETTCGIKLPGSKRLMCEGRLRRRARATGCESLDAYVTTLQSADRLEQELQYLIDAITTNKTDFFREPAHYVALRERLVPALIRLHGRRPARLKIWSAACSTGLEAYTAAMVLQDLLSERTDFRFSILGTDISSEVLAQAREAIYPLEVARPIPAEMRARYLMQARKPRRSEVRVVPELRRTVRFAHLNLIDRPYALDSDLDVIFCRNVLIYFSRPVQEMVVRELARHLRPGGYLVLGHSESMSGAAADWLQQSEPTIYRAPAPGDDA